MLEKKNWIKNIIHEISNTYIPLNLDENAKKPNKGVEAVNAILSILKYGLKKT